MMLLKEQKNFNEKEILRNIFFMLRMPAFRNYNVQIGKLKTAGIQRGAKLSYEIIRVLKAKFSFKF